MCEIRPIRSNVSCLYQYMEDVYHLVLFEYFVDYLSLRFLVEG
jgi:hypothetical protein